MQSKQEIPLMGAQKGLVLSITPEGGIIHWLGARPDISSIDPSRLVGMVELMPYQDDRTLPADNNDHDSIEILDSMMAAESRTHSAMRHSKEVFMARQPPQIPMPNPLDIQDGEEALSDISPDTTPPNGEMNEHKTAREKKNRARQAQRNHAHHHKEEWQWYQLACQDIE